MVLPLLPLSKNLEHKDEKIKVYERVGEQLEALAKKNVPELEYNEIKRIIRPLNVEEAELKGGSAIVLKHPVLLSIRGYTGGRFTIHMVHKGGSKRMIKRLDYKHFLLPALKLIIFILIEIEKNEKRS
jgi:hypothetical protein